MKKLIILVSLALSSLTTFSQTATKIVSDKDSTVIMSKKLVGYMIEDLKNYDLTKMNMQAMDSLVKRNSEITNDLQERLRVALVKNGELNSLVQQQSYDLDGKDSRIMELTKQLRIVKRQRNWSMVVGVLGVAGVHLSWKYVNWRKRYGSKN